MNKKGFTLIEIAMVLVVIGILLGIGTKMMGVLTKRAKLIDAREVVKTAKEALSGYAVKYGFLPATIGLSGGRELDSWGRNIPLYPDPAILGSGRNACGVTSTNTIVKECITDDCLTFNTKSNIAFIAYSAGEDANGVCTSTGVCSTAGTCPFPTCDGTCSAGVCTGGTGTCICTGTCNAGVCTGGTGTCPTCTGTCTFPVWQQAAGYNSPCTYTAATNNPTFQYDDIVQYVTLDEIRNARSCSQQLAITSSTTLPTGVEDTFYSYQMQATGGITPYTWSVSGQTINTLGCSGGSYPLANPNTGKLCLYTTGLLSGSIDINTTTKTGDLTACSATITVPNTVTVTDSAPPTNITATFAGGTVTVSTQPMTITTQTLQDATRDVAYSVQLQNIGGNNLTEAWSTASALPTGMTLSAGGLLSGTPTSVAGTFPLTITVADTCVPSNTVSKAFALNLNNQPGGPCAAATAGITVRNNVANNKSYRKNGGCTTPWNLNVTVTVLPTDTILFYSNTACATQTCATSPAISYSSFQNIDSNQNCSIQWTAQGVNCAISDL